MIVVALILVAAAIVALANSGHVPWRDLELASVREKRKNVSDIWLEETLNDRLETAVELIQSSNLFDDSMKEP
jgi:hypothetical protein